MLMRIIFSRWYNRVVLFTVISVMLYLLLTLIMPADYRRLWDMDLIYNLLALFGASAFTELLRPNSKWYYFGLFLNKSTFREIAGAVILTAATQAIFLIAALIIGLNIEINYGAADIYFVSISLFIAISAVIEELLFRGVLFQIFLERFSPGLVIIISSIVFSVSHIFNPDINFIALINIFLASLLMSIMYYRTKSLWMPIFFHILWNWSSAVFLGSNVSGYNMNIALIQINSYDSAVFGGMFGIEGSFLTTIVLIGATAVIMKLYEPSPYAASKLYLREYDGLIAAGSNK